MAAPLKLAAVAVLFAVAGLFASQAASAAPAYRWKYWPLFVFAQGDTAVLAKQKSIVSSQAAAFKERNIVVEWIVGDKVSADFGPPPGKDPRTQASRDLH